MAIFYEHIKGCGKHTSSSNTETPDGDTGTKNTSAGYGIEGPAHCYHRTNTTGSNQDFQIINNSPKIYINTENIKSTNLKQCLGHIITSDAVAQYISSSFTFKSSLTLNLTSKSTPKDDIFCVQTTKNNKTINPLRINQYSEIVTTQSVYLKGGNYIGDQGVGLLKEEDNNFIIDTCKGDLLQQPDIILKQNTQCAKHLHVGKNSYTWPTDYTDGIIVADTKCEAPYFNATSDKRAKSNITPTQFSALTVVKNLPIYTFNYNNKPEEKAIGLIAQEAAKYDLEGFNMVDNLNASGENNDFMQMKESKLVYVLWKAVQELSAEVEELKAQLNNK